MGTFQLIYTVINKYLKNLDNDKLNKAFENFQKFYGDKLRLHNIMQLKEENYQEGFLREIFVETLGYTINPDNDFNLTTEFKNLNDARKADGAIVATATTRGHVPLANKEHVPSAKRAIAVIELKSTKTKHLESIKEQAFSYKNNQPRCRYVITSNFQNLRFYIDDATEYEEFNLFRLADGLTRRFKLFYLLLSKESIFSDLPHKLKEETKFHENDISAQLYEDYKRFKNKIFENLVKNNPQYDKLLLFKKSQKLLDRFLFVFFAEDSGLIPPNTISKIIEQWKGFIEEDEYFTLYSRFQKLFSHLDKGHTYKKWGEIPAYNGGLFRDDELLDSNKLIIDDEVLEKDSLTLSAYDFNTEVDVNILGHIFEHSLNEIEEITAKLSATAETNGHVPLKKTSKRKKDGIFYTPKYITKYIVENTVGTLCKEKKEELKINNILINETYHRKATTRGRDPLSLSEKGKKLYKTLNTYKDWLLTLKILDPACGSGAFLNATLDFLIAEHKQIDNLIAELTGDALGLFDTDKAILENNIYGVDINEESVEIAKLSMWLRTAQKGRPLSDLSGNIKCGNSLIDDPEVAGDKAFNWHKEFPQIFKKKKKEAWHITLATHDSRTSQRMIDYKVRLKRDGGMRPKAEPIWLDTEDELFVTEHIAEVIKEDDLNVTAYNICGDHVHLLLICEKEEMPKIVGKIKAVSARKYNIEKGITAATAATRGHVLSEDETESESDTTRGHVPLSKSENETFPKKIYNSLWVQKFGKKKITDKEQYRNTLNYIVNNRIKHELPENKDLQNMAKEISCTAKHAFRPEYTGGFDVVIGNPPWGAKLQKKEVDKLSKLYQTISKTKDSYQFFVLRLLEIVKRNGFFSFIIPNTWMLINTAKDFRKLILQENIIEIVEYGDNVFSDATVESMTLTIRKTDSHENLIKVKKFINQELNFSEETKKNIWLKDEYLRINIGRTEIIDEFIERLNLNSDMFKNVAEIIWGIKPYQVGHGTPKQTKEMLQNRIYHSKNKIDDTWKPLLVGSNINRFSIITHNIQYVKYGKNLMYPSNEKKMLSSKILLRQTSDILRACVDNNSYYCQNSLFIITSDKLHLKYLNLLLNSNLINYVYTILNPQKGKVFAEIKPAIVKFLPIKQISKEAQQPFIKKTDQMLSLNKELQNKSDKFIKRIKSNLEATASTRGQVPLIIKISKKLQNFYNYDFKTFIAELNKQKIKLSLTQQDEWEDYFDTYKQEINQVQTRISQTDKEIDKMVYELYELTEEEIGIVEGSVK